MKFFTGYSTFILFTHAYISIQISSERNTFFFLARRENTVKDVSTMDFTTLDVNSQASCIVTCATRQNCGHVVFCQKSELCYLDYKGVNYCRSQFDGCKCFGKWRRLAGHSRCEASSEFNVNSTCSNALDGSLTNSWNSDEGVGAWIKIHLDQPEILVGARLLQRAKELHRNKDIRFQFSDGSFQELRDHQKNVSRFWNDIDLDDVKTSWVNITILSVYSEYRNGWKEIELYSSR